MNQLIKNYLNGLERSVEKKVERRFSFDELKEVWIETGKTKTPEYEFDNVAEAILRACYIVPSKKGVVFSGVMAIGKTFNLDIFETINTHLFHIRTECYEVAEIELRYKSRGANFLEELAELPCLVINDVDTQKQLNDFGTIRGVVTDVLLLRYRNFQKKGFKTYLTTNMSMEYVNKEFGDRLESRFKEMFFGVQLKGKGKR